MVTGTRVPLDVTTVKPAASASATVPWTIPFGAGLVDPALPVLLFGFAFTTGPLPLLVFTRLLLSPFVGPPGAGLVWPTVTLLAAIAPPE